MTKEVAQKLSRQALDQKTSFEALARKEGYLS
jgi:hypothetical protein